MNPSASDRVISILTYFTFGIFGLIWLVFANLAKKRISHFLAFNIYQSIFVSILLAIISLLYGIAINFISVIPFVGKFAILFDRFFNQTPMYFSYTVSGLLVTLLVVYFSLFCLVGRKPFIPIVSDIVYANCGD